MKKKELDRIAGPQITALSIHQVSPMGFVPKKNGYFKLIQHLSYPANNLINDCIDKDHYSVQYSSVDE